MDSSTKGAEITTPRCDAVPLEVLTMICSNLSLEDIHSWLLTSGHFYHMLLGILHERDSEQDHNAATWACQHGYIEVVQRAISAGTDVNHRFPPAQAEIPSPRNHIHDQRPPMAFLSLLHIATWYNQVDIMKYLMEEGADKNVKGFFYAFWLRNIFPKPIYFAKSPEAVELLISTASDGEEFGYIIQNMSSDNVSLPTVEAVLDRVKDMRSLSVNDILTHAAEHQRPDIMGLVLRRMDVKHKSSVEWSPGYMIGFAMTGIASPLTATKMKRLINIVLRLPHKVPPASYIDAPMFNLKWPLFSPAHKCTSLLQLSLEPWVPTYVTKRILGIGADLHLRRYWPSYNIYITGHFPRALKSPYFLASKWQKSGTALGYCLAHTISTAADNVDKMRPKAQLLIRHGAGFEPTGYPVSFLLSTIVWPWAPTVAVQRAVTMFGNSMVNHRNKYGETHLYSLISWVTSGWQEKGKYGVSLPVERWTYNVARLARGLVRADSSYISEVATSGPNKGRRALEILCRHMPSDKSLKQSLDVKKKRNAHRAGILAIMDVLLFHGRDPNIAEIICADGMWPIHVAARFGAPERVQILVTYGARVQAVDNDGWSALHHACYFDVNDPDPEQNKRRVETIRLLFRSGADINAESKDGKTPLAVACGTLNGPIIAELLFLGALGLEDDDRRHHLRKNIELAESKFLDFYIGLYGAMSLLLHQHGDVDYVYDPREPFLRLLDDPELRERTRLPREGIFGHLDPAKMSTWNYYMLTDFCVSYHPIGDSISVFTEENWENRYDYYMDTDTDSDQASDE
ncbi:ankyrin [Jackrogersella minutella]|nr:ankyrin [Jackrogersella minutella]